LKLTKPAQEGLLFGVSWREEGKAQSSGRRAQGKSAGRREAQSAELRVQGVDSRGVRVV
jgi:hypothetical protein